MTEKNIDSNSKEAEMQEKYFELQMLSQHIKQLQQQYQGIEMQYQELLIAKETLEEIKKTDVNTEILVPVTQGVFFKAKLDNNSICHINVGGKVNTETTIDHVNEMLTLQLTEITKMRQQTLLSLQNMQTQAGIIEQELISLTE